MTPGEILAWSIALRRYENFVARRVRDRMGTLTERLLALLQRLSLDEVSPGWRPARAQRYLTRADDLLTEAYRDVAVTVRDELRGLAVVRAAATRDAMERMVATVGVDVSTITLPMRSDLRALVTAPIRGDTLYNWWTAQTDATRRGLRQAVQLGLSQGEGTREIAARIKARLGVSDRDAQSLARTAVNHVSNAATLETMQANPRVVKEYEWVSTLDERTTLICRVLDGKRFRFDDPKALRPPAHWNCRSTVIAVINGFTAAVDRATQEEWLRAQPQSVQERALGVTKARLWRSGRASLDDMLRSDGREYTLAQLAERGVAL